MMATMTEAKLELHATDPENLRVQNGYYTVSHPGHGHYTLKLSTVRKGDMAGQRIWSLLTGPSNETDYTGVATWNDSDGIARVWRRHRAPLSPDPNRFPVDDCHWSKRWSKVEKKLAVALNLLLSETHGQPGKARGYWRQEGYDIQASGRCLVCNRTLTVPESIASGIGPECRAKLGL